MVEGAADPGGFLHDTPANKAFGLRARRDLIDVFVAGVALAEVVLRAAGLPGLRVPHRLCAVRAAQVVHASGERLLERAVLIHEGLDRRFSSPIVLAAGRVEVTRVHIGMRVESLLQHLADPRIVLGAVRHALAWIGRGHDPDARIGLPDHLPGGPGHLDVRAGLRAARFAEYLDRIDPVAVVLDKAANKGPPQIHPRIERLQTAP